MSVGGARPAGTLIRAALDIESQLKNSLALVTVAVSLHHRQWESHELAWLWQAGQSLILQPTCSI